MNVCKGSNQMHCLPDTKVFNTLLPKSTGVIGPGQRHGFTLKCLDVHDTGLVESTASSRQRRNQYVEMNSPA